MTIHAPQRGFTPLEKKSQSLSQGYAPHGVTRSVSLTGFTLVETMVAITVLAIALVGPFIAVQTALQGSYVARDQLVATHLAQEAAEYIRSVRDNNSLSGRSWMDGLSSYSCYGANPTSFCVVDPTKGDIHTDVPDNSAMTAHSSIVPGDCAQGAECLYISSANLYNQQELGTPTKFKRVVQIRTVGVGGTEVRVTVQVFWTTGAFPYSTTVVDNLHDWI
ncbi:type II secretion system GspH family protein [Candidatus Parcubacteria bacterium]|nr:type II secretion system GspH family protein [Candidatus Parcubacteria bacterium]